MKILEETPGPSDIEDTEAGKAKAIVSPSENLTVDEMQFEKVVQEE